MSVPPANPKIYHITHVDNLLPIIAAGSIGSDAQRMRQGPTNTNVGMLNIKRRRLTLTVDCHPGTTVGEYVPFYFCPRSVMLCLLHRGNHPDLSYSGGQRPIVHLEADLETVVQWAETNSYRWAFSKSNARAYYTRFFNTFEQLDQLDWNAVAARDFHDRMVQEGKQAEFLLHKNCPWHLIEQIGMIDVQIARQVEAIVKQATHQPIVNVQQDWYY